MMLMMMMMMMMTMDKKNEANANALKHLAWKSAKYDHKIMVFFIFYAKSISNIYIFVSHV